MIQIENYVKGFYSEGYNLHDLSLWECIFIALYCPFYYLYQSNIEFADFIPISCKKRPGIQRESIVCFSIFFTRPLESLAP